MFPSSTMNATILAAGGPLHCSPLVTCTEETVECSCRSCCVFIHRHRATTSRADQLGIVGRPVASVGAMDANQLRKSP